MTEETKPKPIYITATNKKIAAAYANRPPTKRQPYWSWKMRFKGPCGKEHTISLGRCALNEVSSKMFEQMKQRQMANANYDYTEIHTVGNLLRAWYENEIVPADLSSRTKDIYKRGAKTIVDEIDTLPLSQLSKLRILQLRNTLLDTYSSTTVHTRLQALQFAINWGRKMKIPIPEFQFKNKRGTPKENYTPTKEEVGKVLSRIRDLPLMVATFIAWQTGARVGEVFNLKRSDFVKHKGYGKVLMDGKTGPRWVTLNKCNWMVIQYAIHDFPEELFSGMSASNSSTDVGDISEEFGSRFTFQALRRLRSKTLIERGLPIKQYQEEMGHSYKTAMEHYLRYRPEEVLDML